MEFKHGDIVVIRTNINNNWSNIVCEVVEGEDENKFIYTHPIAPPHVKGFLHKGYFKGDRNYKPGVWFPQEVRKFEI